MFIRTSVLSKSVRHVVAGLLSVLVPISALAATGIEPSRGGAAPQAAGDRAVGDVEAGGVLEVTKDQCSRAFVLVEDMSSGQAKTLSVKKGESVVFKPAARRFSWYCSTAAAGQSGDTSKEWTTCAVGTDKVKMFRDATGREITWKCLD